MAHKIKSNHYVATHRTNGVDSPSSNGGGGYVHRGYSTDGEESHRAPSERTLSEYTTMNERGRSPAANARRGRDRDDRDAGVHSAGRKPPASNGAGSQRSPTQAAEGYRGSPAGDDASDVYVTSAAYKSPSEISRHSRGPRSLYSYRSAVAPSVASTHRSKVSRKAGIKVDAMAAPNPFCPSVKGMCCLMLLLNLGLILVTLGFVIVIQFFEPLFVWILGIVFLIFGFLTLIGSLVYCVVLCRDSPYQRSRHPDDLYWTHHWSKTIGPSEIHYRTGEKPYHNGNDDRYSDRYSVGKTSGKYSDRESKLSRY